MIELEQKSTTFALKILVVFAIYLPCLQRPRALQLKMTFEQTPGGSGPGSPGDEADVGEVVTMVDVLKDGRDMEENAKVLNSIVTGLHHTQTLGGARGCLRECL